MGSVHIRYYIVWGYIVNIAIIFNQVAILFIVMVVGFFARKTDIINDEVNKKLSELLLNITAPFMVIASFQFEFSKDMLLNAGIILIISIAIHAFSILIGTLLYGKYPGGIQKVLRFITVFANCGFMGYPVLESLFGKIGIFYGSIYVIAFNVFIWTYGVALFNDQKGSKSLKKAVINPGVISVFIGLVIFVFSIKLPFPVSKAIDMVGSMTTPISMLIVGALLADTNFKDLFKGFSIYYGIAVRLLLLPILALVVLKTAGMKGLLLSIPVVLSGMPAAANTAIFAERYNGDSIFASRAVALSTVLSILTIPLMVFLIGIL